VASYRPSWDLAAHAVTHGHQSWVGDLAASAPIADYVLLIGDDPAVIERCITINRYVVSTALISGGGEHISSSFCTSVRLRGRVIQAGSAFWVYSIPSLEVARSQDR
jgi:hypothetical protein